MATFPDTPSPENKQTNNPSNNPRKQTNKQTNNNNNNKEKKEKRGKKRRRKNNNAKLHCSFTLTQCFSTFLGSSQTPAQSQWTVAAREGATGQVDAQRALRNLARWVATTAGLPRHDHTMLLTGLVTMFV